MAQPHRVAAAVPLVEVADHRHAPGIGCPHGKAHAGHIVLPHGLGTQAAGQFPVPAFGDQVQVQVAQQQAEGVGVFRFLHRFMAGAGRPDHAQPVGAGVAVGIGRVVGQPSVEQPSAPDRRQFGHDLAARVDGLHAPRAGMEGAHHPVRPLPLGRLQPMRPQHRERVAQPAVRQRVQRVPVEAGRQRGRRLLGRRAGRGRPGGRGEVMGRGHGGPPSGSRATGGATSAGSSRRATRARPASGIGSHVGRLAAS